MEKSLGCCNPSWQEAGDGWHGGQGGDRGSVPNPEAQTAQGEPQSGLSSPQDPGNGLEEEQGDPEPAGTLNHQQRLEHIVRRAAVQDKVRAPFLPQFLSQFPPALSWPARHSLAPLELGVLVWFPLITQFPVSPEGIAGTGMSWIWVTFQMCPGKFSGLREGRAVGVWAEIVEFGLCGKAALE